MVSFSVQKLFSLMKSHLFPYDFLNVSFILAYFTVRTLYIVLITCKVYVNGLFMLPVRLPVNSRLVVKFWGSQKLNMIFDCTGDWCP